MASKFRRSKSLDRLKPSVVKSAMIPPVALSAVPKTKVDAPTNQWGMSPELSNSGTLPRLFATLQPPGADDDIFSDPESSLYDYQQMDEAGYSTVEFGTWPKRRSQDPLQRKRSSKNQDDMASTAQELYHVLENDNAIYAVPDKPKFRKSVTMEDEIIPYKQERELQTSLRTTQDVREAMQAVHDLPNMEETTQKFRRGQNNRSYSKRGSGRHTKEKKYGSQNDNNMDNEENIAEFLQNKLTPEIHRKKKKTFERPKSEKIPPQQEIQEPMIEAVARDVNMNMNRSLPRKLKPGESSKARTGGHSSRGRSPHEVDEQTIILKERTMQIAMENERLQQNNEEMSKELSTLREVATAVSEGDTENASSLLFKKAVEELKEENEHLKSSVHRVNHELSQYQAKYRPLTENEKSKLEGLPSTGPIPSWLINKKYLAPLFLAYDDELKAKDSQIEQYQSELFEFKRRASDIIQENKRLRLQGGYGNDINQNNTPEWHQLQEQARLVLEENQILMEQMEVVQNKSKAMHNAHLQEVSRLTKKFTASEADKMESEKTVEELKIKYRDIKQRNDVLVISAESQVSVEQHITTIANLKRTLNEGKEIHDREKETLVFKLKAAESEQKSLARQVADITAENRNLMAQMKTLERSVGKAQQKLSLFQKAIEQSENKEMITQEQLAHIIKLAEITALERDTYAKAAKDQHQESKKTINKMLQGSVAVGKLEERLKLYKMKAAAKLTTVADRLKDQDESFQSQRDEYEREIRYLRLVISEKEQLLGSVINEKRSVEDDLENMWQAANSENLRLKDTMRKTRKLQHDDDIINIEEDELLKLPADEE